MKFIQVFNRYLRPGGEENSATRIARHLELGGHRVTRFWRSSQEWSGERSPGRFRQLFLLWRNPAVLDELRKLHSRESPDAWILHNVVPVISLGVYRLAGQLGAPVIQWLHNYRPLSPGGALKAGARPLQPGDPWIALKETLAGSWRNRFLTGWLSLGYAVLRRRGDFASVRAWIAVSEEMKSVFLRAGWPADRLFALHHSWDISERSTADRDDGHFLYLGRMIEAKGVRFVTHLWRDPALKGVPLVMAGEGPLRDELGRTSPESIRWVGYVQGPEKRQLLAGCRAVILPSLWPEPLSTVAYEAYEAEKPVLSSDAGGMREIVLDGQTGRTLEPGDLTVWRDAVLQLVADRELARRWGAAGRRWLEENVSPASWNRQFEAILSRALRR